jgi:hypothetical protein
MQHAAHAPGTAPPFGAASEGDTSTTDQAKQQAQEVAGKAQEKAQETAQQARSHLRDQVDTRSTQAGEQVSSTASDLRSVGDSLRQQGKDQPAKLAEQAAERAEKVGSYLKESDADRILHDVEDAARQRPWAVVLGGLAAGFAASRLLKASSSDRYQSRSAPSTPQIGAGTGTGAGNGASDPTGRFDRPPTAHPAVPVTPPDPHIPPDHGGPTGPGAL